jgi:hypothetical protein
MLCCELDGHEIALRDQDLTPAGLFVPTPRPEVLDRELELRLRSPVGEAVLRALVVQVIDGARAHRENRRAGFGVLFTDLLDDQRAFIGLTLDALARARSSVRPPPGNAAPTPARDASSSASASQTRKTEPRAPSASSSPPPTRDPVREREGRELVQKLSAELLALAGKPPWSVLGLDSSATREQARAVFIELSKRCHPHRYARYDSPELTRLSTELFIAYKRAASVVGKLAPRIEPMQPIVPSGQSLRPPPAASASLRPGAKGPRSGTGSH